MLTDSTSKWLCEGMNALIVGLFPVRCEPSPHLHHVRHVSSTLSSTSKSSELVPRVLPDNVLLRPLLSVQPTTLLCILENAKKNKNKINTCARRIEISQCSCSIRQRQACRQACPCVAMPLRRKLQYHHVTVHT